MMYQNTDSATDMNSDNEQDIISDMNSDNELDIISDMNSDNEAIKLVTLVAVY